MVRAHLAFLLLGLGATQALIADNDRNRHWAEGVYFPPATGVDVIPGDVKQPPSLALPQHSKHNPWSSQSCGDIYSQPRMSRSLGFPADQYNPYQVSESVGGRNYSGQNELYVPEYYSSTISGEYEADNSWIKYRDKELWRTESHYRDQYHSDPYKERETRNYYRNGYPGNDYDYSHRGRVMDSRSGKLSVYEIPYSYTTADRPLIPGLAGARYGEDYGNTFFPWGLLLPFSDAEIPQVPLW